jgi:hypothetical protein
MKEIAEAMILGDDVKCGAAKQLEGREGKSREAGPPGERFVARFSVHPCCRFA